MVIVDNSRMNLLYLRLDDRPQDVINRRVDENVMLDISENGRIVGIEILDASQTVRLETVLPIEYVMDTTER